MIVSVRLQQSKWASAFVMALAVFVTPAVSFGQSEQNIGFQLSDTAQPDPIQQTTTAPPQLQSSAEARGVLLKARQALALGDMDGANEMLASAKTYSVDFQKLGDSPATIQTMIDRQSQIIDLRQTDKDAFHTSAAAFLLTQAEALIFYQDFDTAESLIEQARKFPVQFNAVTGNPDQLMKVLEVAKSSATVAQPTQIAAAPASKKPEALKLLSQAQLAVDQERWNEAKFLVDQAKNLNVPESDFAANEPRPWQYELKIQNALNRQAFDPKVMQTGFAGQESTQTVVQAAYDPAVDQTANVGASATMDASQSASRFNPIPNNAVEFYRSGLRSLDDNNPQEARAYFERAWQNRDQLDALTQQSIQDQLMRLTAGTPTSRTNAIPATQASTTMPLGTGAAPSRTTQQQSVFRKLQSDVFRERASAERLLERSPREALEKMTMVRGRIAQSDLDGNSQRPLLKIIDNDINEMQRYIEQNLSEIVNEEQNIDRKENVELRRQRRVDVDTQIQKLVEDFNQMVDEERYQEALVVARQAKGLDPDNEVVVLLAEKAKLIARMARIEEVQGQKETGFWEGMQAVRVSSVPGDYRTPVSIGDAEEFSRNSDRRASRLERGRYSSEADRRIWNILRNENVEGEYKGTLAEAIDQLSLQTGVNIVFDDLALSAANVQKDRLIDVPIRNAISLQSALEIILQSAGLVFVVENEVIKVTTADARTSKLEAETYYIGDLVMPMSNPRNPMEINFMTPNTNPYMGGGGSMNVPNNQMTMNQQIGGGSPGNPFGGMGYGGGGNGGPQTGQATYGTVGQNPLGGITEADFDPLIELIQNTINTDSWTDNGGLGTIDAFVSNLSLIVSQTQEVQDKIQDLLKKLRELNDVQIVVEVRFISLRDEFFERVGIDFDFAINDNSGVIDPNADTQFGGSSVIGRQPVDPFQPTSDFDLEFLQGTFAAAEPLFGGFETATAANFGFAILSDIEVFFLIQASKGDERTNLTTAPVVTMFNGQSASVSDGASRPFVTSVIPVVGDFAVAHQPVITLLPDGTNLNVTAVVSDDRKYVRLQLVPFFSQVTSVDTFTFNGSQTTEQTTGSVLDNLLDAVDGSADLTNEEIQTQNTGITVQLPVLSFTTVNTVVSVPDGGTVLMGGIKRMSEGRRESGVPFLSNVPYVNRLFKNVGIGHETSNLMMMVTPRIIIQEEIEQDQVGLSSDN